LKRRLVAPAKFRCSAPFRVQFAVQSRQFPEIQAELVCPRGVCEADTAAKQGGANKGDQGGAR
jgi:hypothetical protein